MLPETSSQATRLLGDERGLGSEINQVNSYMGTHKMNAGHPSVLAHVTNVNLSEPVLSGNSCQGNLGHSSQSPRQLEPAHLALETRTRWPYKEMPNLLAHHTSSHVVSSDVL